MTETSGVARRVPASLIAIPPVAFIGLALAAGGASIGLAAIPLAVVSLIMLGSWPGWVKASASMGGTPVLVFLAGVLIYMFGSIQFGREAPFSNVISEDQWRLYIVVALICAIALSFALAARERRYFSPSPDRTRTYPGWVLFLSLVVGLGIVWANFATGSIPLFSDSINQIRREGVGGVLAEFSSVGYASLQFALVAAVLVKFSGFSRGMRITVIVVVGATLFATGSRSFLILPIVAMLYAWVETKRPRTLVAGAVAIGLIVAAAFLGQIRSIASGSSAEAVAITAERYGWGSELGVAVLSNLQAGPRVFAVTMQMVPDRVPFQGGAFFLRDFPYIVGGATSDRWVTEMIMNREVSAYGGLPPTLIGGFYIDWGFVGAVVGPAIVFLLLGLLRPRRVNHVTAPVLAYSVFAAYVTISYYSYVSLKLSIVVILGWSLLLVAQERRRSADVDVIEPQHSRTGVR